MRSQNLIVCNCAVLALMIGCTDLSTQDPISANQPETTPDTVAVARSRIDGCYAVISSLDAHSLRVTDLSRGPYYFPDTSMSRFYPEQIKISGNTAESLFYYHISRGTYPNFEYVYNYSMRATAKITWRINSDGSTLVAEFDWRLLNGDGAQVSSSIDYMSFDSVHTIGNAEIFTVAYCDNATRYRDPWLAESNNDPVYFTEQWIKIDSSIYNGFRMKSQFL